MLNQATEDQLRDHLEFLSSDLLEGRAPGTRGEALAAGYIASHFRASGTLQESKEGKSLVALP